MENKITLDEVKIHLNIDKEYTEEDNYLLSLIQVAELQVEQHLNGNSIVDENGVLLPNLKHAMLLLIGTLYANRESVSYSQAKSVPHAYDYLIQFSKSYDF